MAIEFETHAHGGILHVRTWGHDTGLEDTVAYGMGILGAAAEANTKRILCDERELVYLLGALDTYAAARALAEHARGLTVAIVTSPEQAPELTFYEDTTNNSGVRLRVFSSMSEAEAWIGSN